MKPCSRRLFIHAVTAVGGVMTRRRLAFASEAGADGPGFGVIGIRYQGAVIAALAKAHGRLVGIAEPERAHYTFRWWQAYSGGKLTDWGAHHIDIARWAIGSEPVEIEGRARYPDTPGGYDVPAEFSVRYRFANGVELNVADQGRNGILFSGSEGRIFVNRGVVAGKPVDELRDRPLPREAFTLYDFDNRSRPERTGKIEAIVNHMGNFLDCVAARRQPIADVEAGHRSVSACHLGNISCRLGRKLTWDPAAERFVGDAEADAMLSRPQRRGFEVRAG
jgi:myo-inositol 2-dehydrogenase/D-chiro-inositol 1-dehydrogenase